MGDIESLLLVIAIIYLTECMAWVRRGSLAILKAWNGRWRLQHPGTLGGNARGAVALVSPIPSVGTILVAHPLPMSLSPEALLAFTSVCLDSGGRPPHTARWLPYTEVRTVETDGRQLLVNGTSFLVATSPTAARRCATLLRDLKAMPASKREDRIRRAIYESLDPARVKKRWEEYSAQSIWLRRLGAGLFLYLFIVAPGVLWRFGFDAAGLSVAAGLLLQTVAIGYQFWCAHGALYPSGGEERFAPFLTMLLAPPTAIRAYDLLSRRLVEEFHPLAVAQVFCPGLPYRLLARRVLIDLRYPLLPSAPSEQSSVVETEEWYRRVLLDECEKSVAQAGLSAQELTQPLAPTELVNRAYCPRCGAQFTVETGKCADCGGRPLVSFVKA